MRRLFFLGILLGVITAGAAVVALQRKSLPETVRVEDGVRGIIFSAPKSFRATDTKILKEKNPFFIYGFTPPDVEGVECFVSQTRNLKEGNVSMGYLREGLEGQFKKAYGEFSTQEAAIIDLGLVKGVRLSIKYKVGENNFKLTEIAGTNGKTTSFVSCSAPLGLYPLYKDKFDVLLNSFKLLN